MGDRFVIPLPRKALALLLGLGGASLATCGSPTGSHEPPGIVSLELSGPASLVVHEHALLAVQARDAGGRLIAPPNPPQFSSSDPTVVDVTSEGVLHAVGRGSATISIRVGPADTSVSLRVTARLSIGPSYPNEAEALRLAIGEAFQLSAILVDIDGVMLEAAPAASWSSSNPRNVSVSATGLVTARAPGFSIVTAAAPDGQASRDVVVSDVVAGLPATIRFAHAIRGLGPVTFRPSRGAPVTLSFGESLERPVTSGNLMVETDGFPAGQPAYQGFKRFGGVIQGGDYLSLYAVGGADQGFLHGVWAAHSAIPSDSGLVRLVQGWSAFGVVYLRAADEPVSGLPELCYFDPMNESPYYRRAASPFDVVLMGKYASTGTVVRLRSSVRAGRAFTALLVGDSPANLELLEFPDP